MNDPTVLTTVLAVLLGLAVYLWLGAGLAAVFAKAGEEPFKAWIPVWNIVVLLQLGGMSGWLILLALVPVLGWLAVLIVLVMACHRVGRGFGVGAGMTVLAAVLLPAWASILGWGSARWLGGGPSRRSPEAPPRIPQPGYGVPPRPPVPVPAPTPDPAPTPTEIVQSVPAFRSRARRAQAEAEAMDVDLGSEDDDLPLGRPQPPFTETVPSSFTPAHAAPPPVAPRRAFAPGEDDAHPAPSQPARPQAPVQAVPQMPAAPVPAAGWGPVRSTTAVDAIPARVIHYSPPADPDAPFDTSGEVSAVAGAPTLGAPRSAWESVSAQDPLPQVPDPSAFEETVRAARHRAAWMLIPPLGEPIPVSSDVLIIGRRPGADPERPQAQLVAVSDETRTISKTHARIERRAGGWVIVDLQSTNGVLLIGEDGSEREAVPGVAEQLPERFLLGDADLRLVAGDPDPESQDG